MKTILVPVDFSAVSTPVVRTACALAKLVGAEMVLLHVVPPPVVLDVYGLGQESLSEVTLASERITTQKLRTLVQQCARRGVAVRAIQQNGRATQEILATARRIKAGYIVLGSHGHGAAYDLMVGSVTTGVLRKAPCPVLVVPDRRRK